MEMDTQSDYDKLEMDIQSNEELKDKYIVKKVEKMNSKMIIYSVTQDLEDEELINCITAQNGLGEGNEVKIMFNMKANRGTNIVISCHHTAFNKLLKKDRLSINWERHNIKEIIRPLQCFKCFKYGHQAKTCRRQSACSNCGSNEHRSDTCPNDTKCSNCEHHNTRFGTKYSTDHHSSDRECNIFILELNQLRLRIDYGPE